MVGDVLKLVYNIYFAALFWREGKLWQTQTCSLTDDCKPFNPKERAELVNPEDDSPKGLSIRVFMGIVKDTDYQLSLGINVFTVKF